MNNWWNVYMISEKTYHRTCLSYFCRCVNKEHRTNVDAAGMYSYCFARTSIAKAFGNWNTLPQCWPSTTPQNTYKCWSLMAINVVACHRDSAQWSDVHECNNWTSVFESDEPVRVSMRKTLKWLIDQQTWNVRFISLLFICDLFSICWWFVF